MKGNLLSFTFNNFSESGLFNRLKAKKIKNRLSFSRRLSCPKRNPSARPSPRPPPKQEMLVQPN
jgi:hypothetical protein